MSNTEQLLTPDQLAARLQMTRRAVERWRLTGNGPVFIRVGGRVRYDVRDLEAWLAARRRQSTSDQGAERASA